MLQIAIIGFLVISRFFIIFYLAIFVTCETSRDDSPEVSPVSEPSVGGSRNLTTLAARRQHAFDAEPHCGRVAGEHRLDSLARQGLRLARELRRGDRLKHEITIYTIYVVTSIAMTPEQARTLLIDPQTHLARCLGWLIESDR